MEQAWKKSYLRANSRLLKLILADDYSGTDSLGRTRSKAEELASIRPAAGYRFASIETADVRVRVYGKMVVVTGRSIVKIRHADQYLIGRFRYTHVYVKRQGRWQTVASQLTGIADGN